MNASIFFKSRRRPIHLDGKTREWLTKTGKEVERVVLNALKLRLCRLEFSGLTISSS